MQRLVIFVQLHHFTDHTEAIAVGIQLGLTALGTIAVFHHYVFHLHVVVHRVDRHLCLDLESLGKYRERLYKFIAESAITGHDILNVGMKQAVDPRPHQTVAEIVERALVLRKISRGKPVSHHHIRLVLQYPVYHLLCAIQRICVISVDHQVTFRIDLTEHPAYYISLSLCIFIAYDCSCLRSQLHSAVGGIVIIYIGHCLGQELFHIRHHLGDGLFLVIAGNQYRNFIHFPFLVFHFIIQSIT